MPLLNRRAQCGTAARSATCGTMRAGNIVGKALVVTVVDISLI
jgi:hypothetical protein